MIKKNDIFIENLFENKVTEINNIFDGKFEEMLNLIHNITKSIEQNEYNIIENKENIRLIQKDHLDFIKIVTILKEKSDYTESNIQQLNDLRIKYNRLSSIYDRHFD